MPLFAKRRASADTPAAPLAAKEYASTSTPSKLRGMFASSAADSPSKRRLSLSSPSMLFKHEKHDQEKTPPRAGLPGVSGANVRAPASGSPGPPPAAASQQQPIITTAIPSSLILPENYSLSRSAGDFQPSYPVVADDNDYAAISPDGVAAPSASVAAAVAPIDENRTRRSIDTARPPGVAPQLLAEWPALEPRKLSDESNSASPVPTASSARMPLTPPSSAPSSSPVTTKPLPAMRETSPTATSSSRERRPTLTLATSNLDDRPAIPAPPSGVASSSSSPMTARSAIPPITPGSAGGRPDMGGRKTSRVIQSPPMPRPIANLPTFTPTGQPVTANGGWGQLGQGGPRTPGWGQLAREGGPKTPGLALSPRTPGAAGMGMPATPGGTRASGGFPFFGGGEPKSKVTVSEAELRRAARAVPALTREPSTVEEALGDDDIVGDDSDSDEAETETEGASEGASRPAITSRFSLLGKGKQRTSGAAVPLAMDVVHEEGDSAQTIADRRQVVAPKLADLRQNTRPMIMGSASSKSVWALPTPGAALPNTFQQGSWTEFGNETPLETPGAAGQLVSRTPITSVAATPTARTRTTTVDSYFAAQEAASSQASEATTPRAGGGAVEEAVVDSDDDHSAESEEASVASPEVSPETGAGPSAAPAPLLAPPTADSRPALYSQVSRSMINLPTSPRSETAEPQRFDRRNLPKLDAIPSNEQVHSISRPFVAAPAAPEWQNPPPTPAVQKGGFGFGLSALRRRRSADDLNAKPPGYEPPLPGVYIPRPREEEGREMLPGYWCGVHLEGWLPRKVELGPGKEKPMHRPWRRLYCIIHGTQITFYKFDPHKAPVVPRPGEVVPKTYDVTDREAVENPFVFRPTDRFQPPPSSTVRRPSSDAVMPGPRSRTNSTSSVGGERRGSNDSRHGSIDASRRSSATTTASSSASSRRTSISAALTSATSIGTAHASRSSVTSLSSVAEQPGRRDSGPSAGATGMSPSPAQPYDDDKRDLAALAAINGPPAPPRRASVSSGAGPNAQASSAPLVSHLPFQHNTVVDRVSLQGGCEAGHAADYKKRPFVLRMRWADGRQYLVQTDSQRDMIMWLDVLQAGANVSHDLDERVMPKQQQFRRRRRRPATGANAANAAAGTGSAGNAAAVANGAVGAAVPDTPEANAAAVAAVTAASARQREEERRRILAQRQRTAEEDRRRADHALV